MAEHSKLPWQIDEDYPNCIQTSGNPDMEVCECSIMIWDGHKMHTAGYGEDEANAALIVRAVNSHQALVEALEKIARIENQEFGNDWEEIEQARSIAQAALSALREQKD